MSINAAAGYPQASGVLIPEIWSGKLLTKFYQSTPFAAICNTDYEGEISKQGDKVIVRTTPDIEIYDYVKGSDLRVQTPEAGRIELVIDQAKYFNVVVDDIDKFQSDINFMEDWTRDAAEQMKITQDRSVFGSVYADADPFNRGATAGKISRDINLGATGAPLMLTKLNVVDFIVDLGTVLDEQDIPESERKITLPNWACALIKKSELKDASITGDGTSMLRNGRIGMIDRFELYGSNSIVPVVDGANRCFNAIANHKSAISWASQIVMAETIKAESTFGHFARGLQVYGFKVLKPESLVHAYIAKG
jgi:hypothetical protein